MKTGPNVLNQCRLFLVLLAGFAVSTPILAATAVATVSVTVVRTISLSNQSELSFGNISTSSAAGAVQLDQHGIRKASGGVILETGGNQSPAHFIATGEPNKSFYISLPTSSVMTDDRGNEMSVDNFSATSGQVATFNATGNQELSVGATLHVNPNQALGDYTGSMTVSIHYN